MMHKKLQFWLSNVCKIFYLNHIWHGVCKIEYSKHLKRLWRALVIATGGYRGNRRMKVDAVSRTLYRKITLQGENDTSERISTSYAKDCVLKCMCLNSF